MAMTSKLDKLLSIRSRIIGDFEHHVDEINKLTSESAESLMNFRSVTIDKSWKEFADITSELERMTSFHEKPDLQAIFTKNRQCEDAYLNAKIKLSGLMPDHDVSLNQSLFPRNNNFSASNPNLNQIESPTSPNSSFKSGVKMPQIRIMHFSGKYEDWAEFRDLFTGLMKTYKGDDCERLFHLKNWLLGEPKQLIQHIPTQNGNYDEAWNLLVERYENTSAIVDSHLKALFSLDTISHESATTIRNAISSTKSCLSALKNLKLEVSSWDPIIVYMLRDRLDLNLRSKWEEERKGSHEVAKLTTFLAFLEVRYNIIASFPQRKTKAKPFSGKQIEENVLMTVKKEVEDLNQKEFNDELDGGVEDETVLLNRSQETCSICKAKHRIFNCPVLEADAENALNLAEQQSLCINCLYRHKTENCTSKFRCKICGAKHHTLLHKACINLLNLSNNDDTDSDTTQTNVVHVCKSTKSTVLATAVIPVHNPPSNVSLLRVLIDQGSMIDIITEKAATSLKCARKNVNITIKGVGGNRNGFIKHKVGCSIGSLYDESFNLPINAFVTKYITTLIPTVEHPWSNWPHLSNLNLADPIQLKKGNIDMLLGARTFALLLEEGLVKGKDDQPIAQKTKIGWIVSGACTKQSIPQTECHINSIHDTELSPLIRRFWELEEIDNRPRLSPEDSACEEHFVQNIQRCENGKLMVKLPFKYKSTADDFLGQSLPAAMQQFRQLERRFSRNEVLRKEYTKCIEEYISLGHAKLIDFKDNEPSYYLPHHAVIKESSLTTKVRVVFNASAKSTNQFSLNDRMYVGPTIQQEIWSVLLKWQLGAIAVIADIEKMYRQFLIHPDDSKFQRIVWRSHPNEPIKHYELTTVTFGTAAAPFLAIRCLHYIADSLKKNALIANIIKKNFYVDDLVLSLDSIEQATSIKREICDIFSTYGLNLRQWNSNVSKLADSDTNIIDLNLNETCKTLGMTWNMAKDKLSYKLCLPTNPSKFTKRTVLSEISSLYDPLGWLAPVIIRAKIFMQYLWTITLTWDDELPSALIADWLKIRNDLEKCKTISIDRWSKYASNHNHVSLHGFADASEHCYVACVYLRTVHVDNSIHTKLLTSKTKVAPLKQKLTIPKLELCAALLTAKLLVKTKTALELPCVDLYAWSDSAITLSWISTPPHKLTTFISNRVAEIQQLIEPHLWKHVRTNVNAADPATRGLPTDQLKACDLWWHGPPFLRKTVNEWPSIPRDMLPTKNIPGIKKSIRNIFHVQIGDTSHLINRFSNLNTLCHVTAYCLRWLPRNKAFRNQEILTIKEIENAKITLCRLVQQQHYPAEIHALSKQKALPNRSPLLSLVPYLDKNQLLRIRGRLERSLLSDQAKHPIILPASGHFIILIIRAAHDKALHGGVEVTLRGIRDEFWIVRGKNSVKNVLRKCIICFRYRKQTLQQQMADCQAYQVQPNRAFSFVGVDFAGYFLIKLADKRNAPFTKCYVSLFICLTTKAIHLELVSDLSTDAFIAALNRFVSRRGKPNRIHSDFGSNFKGAAIELPNLLSQATSEASKLVQQELLRQSIEWRFIPARAPHFGGLWEAGVKSMKNHLYKILHGTKLRFEDFNTVLTQIEAVLNSRPLYAINDDVNDNEVLTPGHFLIGQAITAIPYPDVTHIILNSLGRYQFLQRLVQEFWKNWSSEYLTQFQIRKKWKTPHENIQIGQIVLVKEDNLPPASWLYGRVVKTYAGNDSLVRSVDIQTRFGETRLKDHQPQKTNIVSRPIHKLCLLPTEDNERLSAGNALTPGENGEV